MPPPRLSGTALRNARLLAESPAGGPVLRAASERDFGLGALLALPPEARATHELEPRPVMGAAPRSWHDAKLAAPTPRGHRQSAARLREAYASGRNTPSEVLDRIVARIESRAFGASTHSPFVALDLDVARLAARESTKRYRESRPLSALDGVPVPIKDHFDMAGLPTRFGTRYRTAMASSDAFAVGLLRQAGALVYAKTHTTEWGMNPMGFNPHFRMPRNPYSRDHAAGGSSTGTAVATALGLCTVASGSDGGGSIRIPSSLNGVFGLKPTFLRISRSGDITGGTVAHSGPLAQSVADLVDFLEITAGPIDPADTATHYAPDQGSAAPAWRASLGRGVKGCRVGVPEREWRDAPAEFARPAMDAVRALERDGAVVRDVKIDWAEHALAAGVLAIGPESYGGLMDDVREYGGAMGDDLRVTFAMVRRLELDAFMAARGTRAALRQSVARALAQVDVIVTPATTATAPRYPLSEDGLAVSDTAALLALSRYVYIGNLTGVPAGVVPVGLVSGLPVGLQVMGDAWDEASVLAVMAHLERAGVAELPRPEGFLDLVG